MAKTTVYIYALVCPLAKSIRYVGRTCMNVHKRLSDHFCESPHTHKGRWLSKLKKLKLKPVIKILEICNNKNWKEREQFWISRYKSEGYNLTNISKGGDGFEVGCTPWNKGKKDYFSKETKYRMGKLISKKLKKAYKEGQRHCTFTLEDHIKGGTASPHNVKPVVQISKKTGKKLREFSSVTLAARFVGVSNGVLSRCLKGGRKSSGGYYWNYVLNTNNKEKVNV